MMIITGSDVRALTSAGVYIFWRDTEALYVGLGRCVGQRLYTKSHDSRERARRECTHVEIRACSGKQLRNTEAQLIEELKPLYNIQRPDFYDAPRTRAQHPRRNKSVLIDSTQGTASQPTRPFWDQ